MKECTTCGVERPLNDFHRMAAGRDGHRAECKDCACARARQRYDAKIRPTFHAGPTTATCRHCAVTFEYVKSSGPRRDYCSEPCRMNGAAAGRLAKAAKLPDRACACGSPDVAAKGPAICPGCKVDKRDPVRARAKERRRTLRLYHMTPLDYDRLLAAQGGRCAICQAEAPSGRGQWHVDHDHRCCPGYGSCGHCIRGLLCHGCNVAIGHAGDDPTRLRAAAAYIEVGRKAALLVAA